MPDKECVMKQLRIDVQNTDHPIRLDKYISSQNNQSWSRNYVTYLIKSNFVHVNQKLEKPKYAVKSGDTIDIIVPDTLPENHIIPENIPLNILFEDDHLLIINKPSALCVHPSPGHPSGTVINALIYHYPEIREIGGRHGIVHRLDQDTTGCLMTAKTNDAHKQLCNAFKNRDIQKEYHALVYGSMEKQKGVIRSLIGRHPVDRKKMSVHCKNGRDAITNYHVIQRYPGLSLVKLHPKTGRTHQIRVHLASMKNPIVGDQLYSGKTNKNLSKEMKIIIQDFVKRQMLHASKISFYHPISAQKITIEAQFPKDMTHLFQKLKPFEISD